MKKYFIALFVFTFFCFAQETLRIGVLSYGTVNWELDVLKHNKLDKKNGFNLELVNLASKNAQSTALLSNDVDMIVHDWVWINLQKANKREFYFYPYSKATGTLLVNKKANINSLEDLKGKKLGVAGGKYSKTWLLFKAYYEKKYNKSIEDEVDVVFASPAILYQKMLDGSILATINFWHFNSKLKPKGFKALISIDEVFNYLDIKSEIPFIGWTFSKQFGLKHKNLIDSFIKASLQSKEILETNDKEWNRIKTLMRVKDKTTFEALKEGYKQGVIKRLPNSSMPDMKKVYELLAKQSKYKYVDSNSILDENIFWQIEE